MTAWHFGFSRSIIACNLPQFMLPAGGLARSHLLIPGWRLPCWLLQHQSLLRQPESQERSWRLCLLKQLCLHTHTNKHPHHWVLVSMETPLKHKHTHQLSPGKRNGFLMRFHSVWEVGPDSGNLFVISIPPTSCWEKTAFVTCFVTEFLLVPFMSITYRLSPADLDFTAVDFIANATA